MAKPSDTSSYIYKSGTSPNTRAVVSQKSKVFGYMAGSTEPGFKQIGVVSEFGHDESRTIEAVRGVGFGDFVAELVPGVTEPMTLTINKTLLYSVNLFQSVGYKGGVEGLVRSLRHHRWPFDIKQEMVFSELATVKDLDGVTVQDASINPQDFDGEYYATTVKALFTFYEGCWLNSYSASYTADASIVAENSSVTVTDITDGDSQYGEYIDSGLSPVNGTAGAGYSLRFAG